MERVQYTASQVVANRVEFGGEGVHERFSTSGSGSKESGYLFNQHGARSKRRRKSGHLENERASRVIDSGAIANLRKGLTRRTAVQQGDLAGAKPQRLQHPLGVKRPNIYLPDGLLPGVIAQRCRTVRVEFDGTDRLEAGAVYTYVKSSGASKQADC